MRIAKWITLYLAALFTACSFVQEKSSGIALTATINVYPNILYANNVDRSEVNICMKSVSGQNLVDTPLLVVANDCTVEQTTATTDEQGCLQAFVKTGIPGKKNINFRIERNSLKQDLAQTVNIEFVSPEQKNTIAGIPWFEKIKIEDPEYFPEVEFISTDKTATLPSPTKYIISDRSEKIFSFTFRTSGTFNLEMLDRSTKRVLWQKSIIVDGNKAYKLGITNLAPSVVAGETYSFEIEALDLYGNLAKDFTGGFKIIDLEESFEQDYLFEKYHEGRFTVIDMVWKKKSIHQILIRSSINSLFGTSVSLEVLPSFMTSIIIEGTEVIDIDVPFGLNVRTIDRFGNNTLELPGQLTITTTDNKAKIPDQMTWTTSDPTPKYIAPITMYTAGSQWITIADPLALVSSAIHLVQVNPLPIKQFTLETTTATAGQENAFLIQATDAYGNIDTSYQGSIAIIYSDNTALAPSSYTFLPEDQGKRLFYFLWFQSGIQDVTVVDTTNTNIQGRGNVVVSPAEPNKMLFEGLPVVGQVGVNYQIDCIVKDQYDNRILNYAGQIALSSTDPNANLPFLLSFQESEQGKKILNNVQFKTSGLQSLTATELAYSFTNTSQSVLVQAGEPNRLVFLREPNMEQLTCLSITPAPQVGITDRFGNIIQGEFTITLGLVHSENELHLTGDITKITDPLGTATFSQLEIYTATNPIALKAELHDPNLIISPVQSNFFYVQHSSAPQIEIQDREPYAGCSLIPYTVTSKCPFRIEAKITDSQMASNWFLPTMSSGKVESDDFSTFMHPTNQQQLQLGWDVSADYRNQTRNDVQIQLKLINADGQEAQDLKINVPIAQQPIYTSDRIQEKSGKSNCIISIDMDNNGWLDLLSCGKNPMQLTAAMQDTNNQNFLATTINVPVDIQPEMIAEIHLGFDGYPDLIATNSNGLVLFLQNLTNNGFATVQQVDLGLPVEQILVKDLNSDGLEDVLLLQSSTGQFVRIFQDLPGQFSIPIFNSMGQSIDSFASISTESFPGKQIVFAAEDGIYLQTIDENGDFQETTQWKSGGVHGIIIYDVNRDGWDDIIGLDVNRQNLLILKNNLLGGFDSVVSFALPSLATAINLADVNQDGYIDIAVAMQNRTIEILFGSRNRMDNTVVDFPSPVDVSFLQFFDINRNNTLDIIASNANEQLFLLGQANYHRCQWSIDAPRMYSNSQTLERCQAAHWDQDDDMEVITFNQTLRTIVVSHLDYNKNIKSQMNVSVPGRPKLAQFADLSGDKIADIVVYSQEQNQLIIGLNIDQNASLFQFSTYPISQTIDTMLLLDIDNDSKSDVLLGSIQTGSWQWWRNIGGGKLLAQDSFILPSADAISIYQPEKNHAAAKFVISERISRKLSVIEYQQVTRTWQLQSSATMQNCDTTLKLSHTDLNNDNLKDIALLCRNGSVQVWTSQPHQTIAYHYTLATSFSSPQALHLSIGDLNQDGKKDILTAGNGFYRLLEQDNFPSFSIRTYAGPMNLIDLFVEDINADGLQDILSCYQDQLLLVHYADRSPAIFPEETIIEQGFNLDYITKDFNRDGLLDIAAVKDNNKDILIAWNSEVNPFETNATFNVGVENIRGIGFADIDQDGLLDLTLCGLTSDRVNELRNPQTNAYPDGDCDLHVFKRTSSELTYQLMSASMTSSGSRAPLLKMNLVDTNHDGLLDVYFPYTFSLMQTSVTKQFQMSTPVNNVVVGETKVNNRLLFHDINKDGWVDIVKLLQDNQLFWLRSSTANTFSFNYLDTSNYFEIMDVNHDKWPDIVYPTLLDYTVNKNSYYNSYFKMLLGSENGFFQNTPRSIAIRFNSMGSQIRANDLDGDGFEDLFATFGSNGGVGWSVNKQANGFSHPISFWIGGSTNSPELVDLNRDGVLDVIIHSDPIANAFNQTTKKTHIRYGR